jgi:hypothetical protein
VHEFFLAFIVLGYGFIHQVEIFFGIAVFFVGEGKMSGLNADKFFFFSSVEVEICHPGVEILRVFFDVDDVVGWDYDQVALLQLIFFEVDGNGRFTFSNEKDDMLVGALRYAIDHPFKERFGIHYNAI